MSDMLAQEELIEALGIDCGSWDGVLALYADRVRWTTPSEFDMSRLGSLLEVRAYNGHAEAHAVRSCLGDKFQYRLVDDDAADLQPDEYLDETQYLDIDSTRSSGYDYVATGGGSYGLPVSAATKVRIRNYIRYGEADGMARVMDFRIVGLE